MQYTYCKRVQRTAHSAYESETASAYSCTSVCLENIDVRDNGPLTVDILEPCAY